MVFGGGWARTGREKRWIVDEHPLGMFHGCGLLTAGVDYT